MVAALPSQETLGSGNGSPPTNRTAAREILRVLGQGLALALSTVLIVVGVVWFIPEGNDYASASLKKHERLAATIERKVVFIGGSNLAFGLDSALIEQETGLRSVNMGMNGYFGVRFMLEEARPFLRPKDAVVIALEYDSFFKSVDGTSADLLAVVKANPSTFSYLTWSQQAGVLGALPYVGQQKLLRLIRERTRALKKSSSEPNESTLIGSVESLAGFNEYGDLTSHLDVPWPYEREDGVDATKTPVDGEIVELISSFARDMRERDVKVIFSYTPAIRHYYDKHRQSIDHLHTLFERIPMLSVPRPPTEFVLPESLFFDTVYHLNAEGRELRTRKVAQDLKNYLAEESNEQHGAPAVSK